MKENKQPKEITSERIKYAKADIFIVDSTPFDSFSKIF